MARYIDLSDAAKAKVQLTAVRKVDWDALLADCVAQADAAKASGHSARWIESRLRELRIDYRSLLASKRFAQTGKNPVRG